MTPTLKQIYVCFFLLILVSSCSSNNPENLVIINATIVDIENNELKEHQSIYIKDGIIESISANKSVFDNSYSVIDAEGKFVIPGLIDAHVHTTAGPEEDMLRQLKETLKGGVTTVRDMGGDAMVIKKWNDEKRDEIPSILMSAVFAGESWVKNDPRATGSAHGLEPGNQPWLRSVTQQDSIGIYVQEAKEFGLDGIKIYADVSAEMVNRISRLAKQHEINVWSHSTIFPIGPMEAIHSGVEVLSHVERLLTVLDSELSESYHSDRLVEHRYEKAQLNSPEIVDLLEVMKDNNVYLDATLFVSKLRAEQQRTNPDHLDLIYQFTKMIYESGIPILAGTDAMYNRESNMPNLFEELELLVHQVGLPEHEALRTVTLYPAEAFNLNNLGEIKEGFQADVLILNHNPLRDISNTKSISMVIKKGLIIE